jgi:hypothetical protein
MAGEARDRLTEPGRVPPGPRQVDDFGTLACYALAIVAECRRKVRPLILSFLRTLVGRGHDDPASQGRTIPSFAEAQRLATEEAARYKAEHRLTPQEAAILDSTIIGASLYPANDWQWLGLALEEVERFRQVRERRGGDLAQQVEFLSEEAWPQQWHDEQRLSFLFEPDWPLGEKEIRGHEAFALRRLFYGRSPEGGGLDAQRDAVASLYIVELWPRQEPFLWKGSELEITESSGALELRGGYFTSHTPISARGRLAAPTFACLREALAQHAPGSPEETLLIEVGFPFDGHPIPRPRAVEPEQVLDDAVKVEHQAQRLSFRLLRASKPNSYSDAVPGETIRRWMAVERP